MKKNTALLLIIAMLTTAVLSSCGGGTTAETASETDPVDTVPAETEETRASHALPELDFGGASFHASYLDWQEYAEYFFAQESTGDAMNDAIFERTTRVEETLNVDMTEVGYAETDIAGQHNAIKASVRAGDDAYQMALMHCFDGMVSEGYLYAVNNLPYIDLDADWWKRETMDQLRLGKNYYYCASDYTIPVPFAVYFNKDMITDYALDNPYALVREGTWTMDKMFDMGTAVTQDVDGDGKYSEGDVVGLALHNGALYVNFMHGAGQFCVSRGSDGKIQLDMNNERMISIVEKLHGYITQTSAAVITGSGTNEEQFGMMGGNLLFRLNSIAMGHHYRDVEENIGIVPYPKYDEAQADYISLNWGGLMGIPASIQNPEMVGAVVELLAWESENTVIPAYYDVMLDGKLARDEDSVEMLDLLFDSFAYDPGMNFFGGASGMSNLLWTMNSLVAGQKSTDFVSFYTKNEKAAIDSIEKFYEALAEIES